MLQHNDDWRELETFMRLLRPLKLTWAEAGMLLHYYWRGLTLGETADTLHLHIREVQEARRTLVTKVAVALGYITAEKVGITVEYVNLPLTPEERRQKVAELIDKGWKRKQIAESLGVSTMTIWGDIKALAKG